MTPPDLYAEAVTWAQGREEFSAERLQRVLRVGFIMRDRLLIDMEQAGVIRRLSRGRFEVVRDA